MTCLVVNRQHTADLFETIAEHRVGVAVGVDEAGGYNAIAGIDRDGYYTVAIDAIGERIEIETRPAIAATETGIDGATAGASRWIMLLKRPLRVNLYGASIRILLSYT